MMSSYQVTMLYRATPMIIRFFFFNDTATTEIYTLSLHDALPIFALAYSLEVLAPFGSADEDYLRSGGGTFNLELELAAGLFPWVVVFTMLLLGRVGEYSDVENGHGIA